MTSPTRSPLSNPFKIRRRGSIILSAGGVLDTRCCPHSTPIHEQFSHLHKSSGDPGLPAALAEDLDDTVLRDSPQVHHQSFLFRLYRGYGSSSKTVHLALRAGSAGPIRTLQFHAKKQSTKF
ncbi:hypothetical protein J6590_071262 [Homalodisca vitripennis]|nr:hypothetical protein J6590_071262 [Homalodisca vitripennis]